MLHIMKKNQISVVTRLHLLPLDGGLVVRLPDEELPDRGPRPRHHQPAADHRH